MNNIKYSPTLPYTLCNLILLIGVMIMFFGRTKIFLRIDFLLYLHPTFYKHISNFSISYLFFAGVGFMWLLSGVDFKYIIALGILVLLMNFVYEFWIPVLNTPDIFDAYYGFAGTISALLFLFITKRYGLRLNPTSDN